MLEIHSTDNLTDPQTKKCTVKESRWLHDPGYDRPKIGSTARHHAACFGGGGGEEGTRVNAKVRENPVQSIIEAWHILF